MWYGVGKGAVQEEETACVKVQRSNSQRVRKKARRVGGRDGREGNRVIGRGHTSSKAWLT